MLQPKYFNIFWFWIMTTSVVAIGLEDNSTFHQQPTQRKSHFSRVEFTLVLSTDDPFKVTTPTTTLSTSATGQSILIISITVPVGILLLIILIVLIFIYQRRKNTHNKPTTSTNEDEGEHEPLCELSYEDICDLKTMAELKKTAENPEYTHREERMASFKDWNYHEVQDTVKLAKAGFYYIGPEDKVRCFMCNLGLEKWEKSDLPWYQHHLWSMTCPYLERCKDLPGVDKIIQEGIKQDNQPLAITATEPMDDIINYDIIPDNQLCINCHNKRTACLYKPCQHACCCWRCGLDAERCRICSRAIESRIPIDLRHNVTVGR